MSPAPVTVRLDPRRLEQLKAISEALNLSSAAVIATLIRQKIDEGVIPAQIPGTIVRRTDDGVHIELFAGEGRTLSATSALRFCGAIREVVSGGPAIVNPGDGWAVVRQGAGFKITASFPGTLVSFPGDLALDLADLIEDTAK